MPLDINDIALIREAIQDEIAAVADLKLGPIHDKLDGLATSVAKLSGEQAAHQAAHDRYESWIRKIARRVRVNLT